MKLLTPTWQSLRLSADRLIQGAAHELAIDLYSQALALPDVPWEVYCALALSRAESRQMLGDTANVDVELSALAEQAAERGDQAIRATALTELAMSLRLSGDLERSLQLGRQALEAAGKTGQEGLKVEALCAMGISQVEMGDLAAARESLQAIEALHLAAEEGLGQIKTLYLKAFLSRRSGDTQKSLPATEQGLRLAREANWRNWEGIFLNSIALSSKDLALQGSLKEQSL